MKKIEVPPDMLAAARQAHRQNEDREPGVFLTEKILEAALLWLSEHPTQPNEDQMDELFSRHTWLDKDSVRYGAREWQKKMFLAPTPTTDPLSPIENLLWDDWYRNRGVPEEVNGILVIQSHNAQVEEAFRRGQKSAEVKPASVVEQDSSKSKPIRGETYWAYPGLQPGESTESYMKRAIRLEGNALEGDE